jgi:hypothetical protein
MLCDYLCVTSNSIFAGGGLGGRKESGQLRFGGRERPFRAPLYDHKMPISYIQYFCFTQFAISNDNVLQS